MLRRAISTLLLVVGTVVGMGQTPKTATVKGYSPALKDNTQVICFVNNASAATDSVRDGHFTLTVPVEKLTQADIVLRGEGCSHYSLDFYLKPGITVNITDTNCLFPLWKVESPLPEQKTSNSIKAYTRETYTEFLKSGDERGKAVRHQELFKEVLKQEIEVMGTLPVDYALVTELEEVARFARNQDVFLYTEQLKELEKNVAARAPKEFKENLVRIHREVYPPQVLKVGEEAVDAELIDIQGEKHHLREVFDGKKYVLLDFCSLGCGPCIMSEFEMIEAYKAQDKLEIVTINVDKEVTWKKHGQNEKVKWKNWNKGESDVVFRYCDRNATPYYILISPDKRIIWKKSGSYPGRCVERVEAG